MLAMMAMFTGFTRDEYNTIYHCLAQIDDPSQLNHRVYTREYGLIRGNLRAGRI